MCRFIYAAAAACFISLPASAAPLPAACPTTGTYADLIATNASGGCFVADKLFSDFFHHSVDLGLASAPDAADISFQTIADAPVAVGFDFTFDMGAGLFGSANLTLAWVVTGPNITSAHLGMEAARTGVTGAASIGSVYCKGGPVLGCPVSDLGALAVVSSAALTSLTDQRTFDPVSRLGVVNSLSTVAAGTRAGAEITRMTYTVDQTLSGDEVPEPATLVVSSFSLIGFALFRRRRDLQQ